MAEHGKPTWAQRIAEAKKADEFTTQDKIDAGRWGSCAVGEKEGWASSGGFRPEGANISHELDRLGNKFSGAVYSDDIENAERIYKEIQDA